MCVQTLQQFDEDIYHPKKAEKDCAICSNKRIKMFLIRKIEDIGMSKPKMYFNKVGIVEVNVGPKTHPYNPT